MSNQLELYGRTKADQSFDSIQPGSCIEYNNSTYWVSQVLHGNPRFTSRKTWTRNRASLARSPWRQVHLKAILIKPDEQPH